MRDPRSARNKLNLVHPRTHARWRGRAQPARGRSKASRDPPLSSGRFHRMKLDARRDPAAGDSRTDHDLVYAARDGDTIAFDALFYRYRDGIFRLGLAITKDPSAAEEIVVDKIGRAHV